MNKESVIALGGGALLRDENRAFAESQRQGHLADGGMPNLASTPAMRVWQTSFADRRFESKIYLFA